MLLFRAVAAIGLIVLIIVSLALAAAKIIPWIVFWIVAAVAFGYSAWMRKTQNTQLKKK